MSSPNSPPGTANGQQQQQQQSGGGQPSSELEVMARRVLEDIATVGTGADVQLQEYIRILAEYRNDCEKKCQYKEAELVQHVLQHLRLEEETRHVRGLTEQQEMERRGLEDAHAMEIQNFNRLWNEKIDAFEEYELDMQTQMHDRHSRELSDFYQEMASREPRHAKYSKDLLNLRTIQQTLATQRAYADAHKVKLKGDKIESMESEKLSRDKADLYERKEQQIRQRHQTEMLALSKRIESRKLELERARKKEMEMLLMRYNNVKRGLESQQNIIRSKTGNLLLKHANNKRSDNSGSNVIVSSMASGAFGPSLKKRQYVEQRDAEEDVGSQ